MAVMLVLAGLASTLVGIAGYAVPAVRDAENLLPEKTIHIRFAPGSSESERIITTSSGKSVI